MNTKPFYQSVALFFLTCFGLVLAKEVNGDDRGIIGGRRYIYLLVSVSTLLFALINAYGDRGKIIKGVHYSAAFWRFVFLAFPTALLIGAQHDLSNLSLLALSLSLYWLVFEITLNELNNSPFMYVGKQALIDRLVRATFYKFGWPYSFFIFKLALLGGSLYLIAFWYLAK